MAFVREGLVLAVHLQGFDRAIASHHQGLRRLPRFETGGYSYYSYGLYLYHIPFIQLLIHYVPQVWIGDRWFPGTRSSIPC